MNTVRSIISATST